MQAETMGRGPDWQAEVARRLPLGRLVTAVEAAAAGGVSAGRCLAADERAIVDFDQKVAGAV